MTDEKKIDIDAEAEIPEVTEEASEAPSSAQIFAQDAEEDVYDESDENSPRWYVVHTYSGHENKVQKNIEKLVKSSNMDDRVVKIVVPTEDYVELKDGVRKLKTRKPYPSYVFVKMIVDNESWYLVRNTQGVTGFVGHGINPVPLTKEEVRRMGIEKVYIELDIHVGDHIKVINGPFEGFEGDVEDVNPEKETLKARISMFGRETPVELVYDQVEQI
jgi:transcriptional antiterminator NusG